MSSSPLSYDEALAWDLWQVNERLTALFRAIEPPAPRAVTERGPDYTDGEVKSGLSDELLLPSRTRFAKPGKPVTDTPGAVWRLPVRSPSSD